MKRQIVFIFIAAALLLGCQSKRIEVKDIEVMAYQYQSDRKTNWNPYVWLYASIDTTGLSENLEQTDSVNYKGYKLQVDQKLMTTILRETRNNAQNYYIIKGDTSFRGCFLGPLVRFRITYSDGKTYSFNFNGHRDNVNSKYHIFKLLYDQLSENNQTNSFSSKQLDLIKEKQKEFASYAVEKDTLNIWFPPPPPPAELVQVLIRNKE